MPTTFKTTRQIVQDQKKKVKQLFSEVKLPRLWVQLFVHDNPIYQGNEVLLHNIKAGKSCPPDVLFTDLKKWIKKNKY